MNQIGNKEWWKKHWIEAVGLLLALLTLYYVYAKSKNSGGSSSVVIPPTTGQGGQSGGSGIDTSGLASSQDIAALGQSYQQGQDALIAALTQNQQQQNQNIQQQESDLLAALAGMGQSNSQESQAILQELQNIQQQAQSTASQPPVQSPGSQYQPTPQPIYQYVPSINPSNYTPSPIESVPPPLPPNTQPVDYLSGQLADAVAAEESGHVYMAPGTPVVNIPQETLQPINPGEIAGVNAFGGHVANVP